MATERFLHMRLSREDCATLDTLVAQVNSDEGLRGRRFPHVGKPLGHYSQSDVVRLAIAEALLRRCEEQH
ncbi:MAG: hypothetical protein OXC25_13650, partial [Thiotrichales bacterium]|nr:hypothetical protein [Thiotrichales bacterium]MCY4284644.1 hypothetical protein [Thiotrichales bacterium]MCY4350883.1 hypothetical protein [Thiotrichales bacterium]